MNRRIKSIWWKKKAKTEIGGKKKGKLKKNKERTKWCREDRKPEYKM